jgi:hypothetical protein
MTEKPQEPTQDDARNLARWENEGGATKRDRLQKTSKGLEIPVPKRREVMDALRKVARPKPKP